MQLGLEKNNRILAEPIQTVLRKYKVSGAYEKLKELTRGQELDSNELETFIKSLDLPENEKKSLLALTVSNYTGLAEKQAKDS